MLVLSRRPGEKILIGDGVVLSVVRVLGNRVQLGIEAPQDVRIRRQEIGDEFDIESDTDQFLVST